MHPTSNQSILSEMPAGTGMVVLAHRLHVFAAPDPLFFMVLLLTHTTPTAWHVPNKVKTLHLKHILVFVAAQDHRC